MQLDVYDIKGSKVKTIDVRDDVFTVPANESLVHQVLVMQRVILSICPCHRKAATRYSWTQ